MKNETNQPPRNRKRHDQQIPEEWHEAPHHPPSPAPELQEALRKNGCRMTRQRRLILEYLSSTQDHPTASKIFSDVSSIDSRIGVATVYNTLSVLSRLGHLKVLEFDSQANRYDTNLAPHINLICRSCGKISDYAMSLPLVSEEDISRTGFEISGHRMECYGTCPACASQA